MQHGRKQIPKKTNCRKWASSLTALLIILAVGLCEPPTPLKEGKESKKLGVLHQISQCGYIRVIPKVEKKEEKFTKKELEIVFFCFFYQLSNFGFECDLIKRLIFIFYFINMLL